MPKALATKNDNVRVAPYSKSQPNADKENSNTKAESKSKISKAAAEVQQRYSDYRDIPLDHVLGEIPCYDDATTVRRKLKKLLADKSNIPGTNKSWTQAGMSKEMEELERREGAVEYHKNSTGPSARSLGTFLKKTGKMGGGDSPAYYWGYVLCEKLRIWEGAKKTKSREEAEQMYRGGLVREDPAHIRVIVPKGTTPTWNLEGRLDEQEREEKMHEEMKKIAAKYSTA
ncbi:MAG: hypothetical protein Q9208_003114 [Pyrenodesmia sp. 3 TL-2023]